MISRGEPGEIPVNIRRQQQNDLDRATKVPARVRRAKQRAKNKRAKEARKRNR